MVDSLTFWSDDYYNLKWVPDIKIIYSFYCLLVELRGSGQETQDLFVGILFCFIFVGNECI